MRLLSTAAGIKGSRYARWPPSLRGADTADLASGILHWAFDTWFTENSPVVRRVVLIVREHHVYPQRVFNYPLTQDVGIMAPFGLLSLTPVLLQASRH